MVLSVRNFSYRRSPGQPPLFAEVNLHLGAGEILCLLGPNGTGKTTLLRCLIGALRADTGEVQVDGQPYSATRAMARLMAYVPQAAADSGLTLLDMALMGRTPHLPPLAMPGHNDRLIARQALARTGVAHLEERPFNRVSGGERQLALIARALAQQPRLLVMDEPTASLDLGNQARVLRTVRDLAREGMTVLVTTHQPEHALLLGAKVVALSGGRVLAHGSAPDVLQPPLLSRLYGTAVGVLRRDEQPVACVLQL